MRIVIIGAGVVGVSTAFVLAGRGHWVHVIDRGEGPGLETSFANGGLLTPSMASPWNAPGAWRVLLRSLGRSDAPLQLRASILPSLGRWGLRFLAQSRAAPFWRNTASNFRLADYARDQMAALRAQHAIADGHAAPGSLRIFRDAKAYDHAAGEAAALAGVGVRSEALSAAAVVAREPLLAAIAEQLVGGLSYPDDETGDAHRFTRALAQQAEAAGVTFAYGQAVSALREGEDGQIDVVRDPGAICADMVRADRVIVAAGSYSAPLLRTLGVDLPVVPAKGYSLTLAQPTGRPLSVPLVDDGLHAVIVPLGDRIRVAGTAEFAGYDLSLPPARIANLKDMVAALLPDAGIDLDRATAWCGLRAMSCDGVPLIGATARRHLWVNTGHGHLGWTMAMGSARLLADLLEQRAPDIDPASYDPRRFGSARFALRRFAPRHHRGATDAGL